MGYLTELPTGHPLKYGYSGESLVFDNGIIVNWFNRKEHCALIIGVNDFYTITLIKDVGGVLAQLNSVYIPRVLCEVFIEDDKMPMQLGDICLLFNTKTLENLLENL